MTQSVNFTALWIASEKERKARMIDLRSRKTLLLGPNGTGKSRITKNLFWALGCEPRKRNIPSWDPDAVVALDFEYANSSYSVIRSVGQIGLFNESGSPLFATGKISRWMTFASSFFNYPLLLQRPNANVFRPAGLPYLTLPYYVDQDGSWGPTWHTYTNLSQFTKWHGPVFDAFTGLRPAAYLTAKQKRDELRDTIKVKQRDLEAHRLAFQRVRGELPKNVPSLDLSRFRAELAELASESRKVQALQIEARAKLVAVVNRREQLHSELQLASNAHRDLVDDLSYLSKIPDGGAIECPTCGTNHQASFHARLELAKDSDSMAALVAELNKQAEENRAQEAKLKSILSDVVRSLGSLDLLVGEKKARLKLDDVLGAHSKKTIDKAFSRVSTNLNDELSRLHDVDEELSDIVKSYEDAERAKSVRAYYANQLGYLSEALHIPGHERVDETKLGSRPASGGSSGPRAVLAVHLAMLAANTEYGDTVRFPFVIDTPQQSGQDEENLSRMIDAVDRFAGQHHSVILAVERLPEGANVSEFTVLKLEEKYALLRADQFDHVSDRLRSNFRMLKTAVLEEEREQPTDLENAELVSTP